jgi:undecaprenyl-diphosphatase
MVLVTMLGDGWVLTAVAAVAIVALVLWHAWRRAIGLFTAIAAAATFVPLMKIAFDRPRPQEFHPQLEALSFPSGHATISVVLYGILAVLIAHGWSIRAKAVVFSAVTAFVTAIALSRIYLSAHWPSDVIGGLLFGLAIVAAFAFVFGHLQREPIDQRRLGAVALAALALAGAAHFALNYQHRLALYAPRTVVVAVSLDDWRTQAANELPAYRVDLGGKTSEPIVLQWAGPHTELEARLRAGGWRLPPEWSVATAGGFARADARADELPVLPRFHDGREPVLTLIEPIDSAGRWVLRIWDSGLTVQGLPAGSDGRLLVGSIVAERLSHPLGQLTLTAIDRSAIYHAATLVETLSGATLVQRTAGASATGPAASYVVLGP